MKIMGAVLASFLVLAARAALADDAGDCGTASGAVATAACSRLIGSGKLAGHDLALVYYHRGQGESRAGDGKAAIADFRQATTIDPRFVGAFNDLGLAFLAGGDNDQAFAAFDRTIALDPRFAVGYGNRGIARQRKGDNDQAILDFGRAIAIDPALPDAYAGRGVSYAFLHDFDHAIADYDAALKLVPDNVEVLNNRADAWRNKRVFAKALDDLDHAIRVQPGFAEAYYTRGETYKDMGDRTRALAEINRAIDLDQAGTYRSYGEKLIAALAAAPAAASPSADSTRAKPPAPLGPVAVEKRVALVIGNSAYQAVGLLPNPARDADMVAAALRHDGFSDVIVVHDAGREAMIAALKTFAKEADAADWAVVYYAGHGMEMAGENYLVPVDARLESDRDVPDEAISLDRILSAVEGARKLRLVVLDACRNNPFLAKMQVSSAARAITRGLARVEPSQATLVAFAAKDGSVASDGDSGNSPFAASFAKHVVEAGVEINKVFRLVRADVLAATGNAQEPFVYGSLPPEDFFFVPPKS